MLSITSVLLLLAFQPSTCTWIMLFIGSLSRLLAFCPPAVHKLHHTRLDRVLITWGGVSGVRFGI